MLLISGDTGSLINPGPNNSCSMCEDAIGHTDDYFVCNECTNYFHQICCKYTNNRDDFICNLCTSNFLPFSSLDTINFDEESNSENIGNIQNLRLKPSELPDNHYECFKRKGLHIIHLNIRSLFPKLFELDIIAKKSNAAVICITETWLNDSHTDDCYYQKNSLQGSLCIY